MTEWPIKDLARATGVTSRTLRHYEQIGLLRPSRVASNGYRYYGDAEVSRLYRILSLRALELPLAAIRTALDDDTSLSAAIETHLALLEERRERTIQQITVVQHTLDAVRKGQTMSIEDVFAGFDPSRYEAEVRTRWGDQAWERSAERRRRMTEEQRQADDRRSLDVNAAKRFGGGKSMGSAPSHQTRQAQPNAAPNSPTAAGPAATGAAASFFGAAETLMAGGGKVTSPLLTTLILRSTTSSKLMSMTPSLFLHNSLERFTRLVA